MLEDQTISKRQIGGGLKARSEGKLRILLLDECALHREAIRIILAESGGASVVEGEAPEEAMASFNRLPIDIVLLSFTFGKSSGLSLIQTFLDLRPSAKVLVVSDWAKTSYARRSLVAGAAGFISKSASSQELIDALSMITRGKIYLDPEIATKLAMKHVLGENHISDQLTLREQEILRLIGEGKDMSAIAAAFGVAYKTIANTCTRIKTKLDVSCTSELIKIACEMCED